MVASTKSTIKILQTSHYCKIHIEQIVQYQDRQLSFVVLEKKYL